MKELAKNLVEMQKLIDKLNRLTKLYDMGTPEVSDKEWDNLYWQLVDAEKELGYALPDSPTQKVHFEEVSKLEKVKHNHPMLSLDKTKEWEDFIGYFGSKNKVIAMPKLDGLTCSLKYVGGKLVAAETRGNGEIGENILHNAKTVRTIPNHIDYNDTLILDGEIICTYTDFIPFENEYKNPRNFASGSIRLLDSKECFKRNLTFVVWNIVEGLDGNSFSNKLEQAKELGFTIPTFTSTFDENTKDFLVEKAKEDSFPIDGLVGRYDDIEYGSSLGSTGHHTKAAYAFKFYDEEVDTRLLNIEWSLGRTGVLTPVAVFEPIELEGTTIERCNLFNLSVLEEKLGKPYVGQKIWVVKKNMIIPYIERAEKMGNFS